MSLSDQLYQANRLDLLSRMAGDISHEIKNPLHAMVINLELVRRKVEKGDGAQAIERVAVVEDEVRKVHALANALLESLRPPRDARASCAVGAVFQEIAPLFIARARFGGVALALANDASSEMVPLAAHDLRQLLLNLADRAIRAAASDGSVAFGLRRDGVAVFAEVRAASTLLDEAERAWLEEAGPDRDDIDLGLRIVRELVDRAGGWIEPAGDADGEHRLAVALPHDVTA